MNFLDDSLLPEVQPKLVIQAAPYAPGFLVSDSDDIPISMEAQVRKAVDCYNAGATVLHVHVREADGRGSKRLSMFNEMLMRLREAVPKMLLQVGGSISFAPETKGDVARWLDMDTRHALAELTPKPDQVTIVVNTNQLNFLELTGEDEIAGTSWATPEYAHAYTEMVVEANPSFYIEHLRRLAAAQVQPHFMLLHVHQLETVERLIRRGIYAGPLNLNYVAASGGGAGHHPADLIEFVRRTPDGAVLTIEATMRSVLPMCTMGIAMGLHVRVGIEDNLWGRKGERMTTVQQIEKMVRIARELGREVADGDEARRIYRIGERWEGPEETLARLGLPPNRVPGQVGAPVRAVR
ncbi:MAG: 3-keto-5-aminohexanoate cleavage protein [Lautropia sp.]